MQFSINSRTLSSALAVVSKAAATNSTIPILAGVHIQAVNGMVTLVATNTNATIRHSVDAMVDEPGETVVSAKVISAVVKGLPDATVDVSTDDSKVRISCGRSKSTLTSLNPANFPEYVDVTAYQEVELKTELFAEIISKVQRVTSKDAQRPVLQGINITVSNGILKAVATDSYRLAVADAKVGDGEFEAIVSGYDMRDAMSVMTGDTVMVGTSDNQVTFKSGSTTYTSRKINGNFPNVRQLMPQSFSTVARFDASEMSEVLKRVTAIGTGVGVKLTVSGLMMEVSSHVESNGDSSDAVVMQFDGPENWVCLNAKYLMDCIDVCDGEVSLQMNSPNQPVVFDCYGDVHLTYLLMPVRG